MFPTALRYSSASVLNFGDLQSHVALCVLSTICSALVFHPPAPLIVTAQGKAVLELIF